MCFLCNIHSNWVRSLPSFPLQSTFSWPRYRSSRVGRGACHPRLWMNRILSARVVMGGEWDEGPDQQALDGDWKRICRVFQGFPGAYVVLVCFF